MSTRTQGSRTQTMLKQLLKGNEVPEGASDAAIMSLIFSVIGILLIVTAIIGIVLGLIELDRIKHNESSPKGKKIALAGVIVGATVWLADFVATMIILSRAVSIQITT